jgi:hypothetical protein
MIEFKNESGLEFTDISSELERIYLYETGAELTIKEPTHLHVSDSGGHRIFTKAGQSFYVRTGWIAIKWTVREGAPNFVK